MPPRTRPVRRAGERSLLLILLPLLLAACGTSDREDAGDGMPTAVPAAPGLVQTVGTMTVYDDGSRTRLCPAGIAGEEDCGGPVITNWDWKANPPEINEGEERFGHFHVVGTFDGKELTVTEAVSLNEWSVTQEPEPEPPADGGPACPEPAGGWEMPDPELTTFGDFEAALLAVEDLPDHNGASIDYRLSTPDELDLQDPRHGILVVYAKDDLERAERAARKHWGGRLCVLETRRSQAELVEAVGRLDGTPGFISATATGEQVELYLLHDDGSIARWADEELGRGLVRVRTALVPASG